MSKHRGEAHQTLRTRTFAVENDEIETAEEARLAKTLAKGTKGTPTATPDAGTPGASSKPGTNSSSPAPSPSPQKATAGLANTGSSSPVMLSYSAKFDEGAGKVVVNYNLSGDSSPKPAAVNNPAITKPVTNNPAIAKPPANNPALAKPVTNTNPAITKPVANPAIAKPVANPAIAKPANPAIAKPTSGNTTPANSNPNYSIPRPPATGELLQKKRKRPKRSNDSQNKNI